jgi:hypothetical protein
MNPSPPPTLSLLVYVFTTTHPRKQDIRQDYRNREHKFFGKEEPRPAGAQWAPNAKVVTEQPSAEEALHRARHADFGDFGFQRKGAGSRGRGGDASLGERAGGRGVYGERGSGRSRRGRSGDGDEDAGYGSGERHRRHTGSERGDGDDGNDGNDGNDGDGSLSYVMAQETGWLSSTAWVVVLGGMLVLALVGFKTLRSGGLTNKIGGYRQAEMRQR